MEVRHNDERHRFEAGSEPALAMLVYKVQGQTVNMIHTEVPAAYQGQGLGGKLATAALNWAREKGFKVIPSCPYVQTYIAKHPEFADLV
jgi:predicted GNAT family acetyltransferase